MAVNMAAALPVRPNYWTGDIDQRAQVALNNRQINDGYIVLCVARAKSDCVIEVGVESHDKLYRNPFLDPLASHELKADIATLDG